MPHANQLWMIVGFALFRGLERLAPCIEVFPQATVRALGAGDRRAFGTPPDDVIWVPRVG